MALLNKLDGPTTARALQAWFESTLDGASDIAVTDVEIPQSSGISMTTVLFNASWTENGAEIRHELVARVAPTLPGMFKSSDIEREFRLFRALQDHVEFNLPTARWLELDPAVLGSPFMILDRAYGNVPADDPPYVAAGWVLDLEPADRRKLFDNTLDVVAQIHALDLDELDVGFLDEPEFGPTGIEQQLAKWADLYDWASEGVRSSTIDAAFVWLGEHRPAGEDLVLSWGDARIGNVMFDPSDLSPAAVLDWEIATIASPMYDVAWFIFMARFYTEGIGVPNPEGMPTPEEMLAYYRERSGRTTEDYAFHEVFAALRLSVLMMRAGNQLIEAGKLPADNPMPISNPASQMLARFLDLPAPEGESTNFIGNR